MNIKKLFSLAIITSITISMPLYANQGHGQGNQVQGSIDKAQQSNRCILEPNAGNEISAEVEAQLQFMGEEEKLARDVYLYLSSVWNNNVFANIARAEQVHIDSVNKFLDAYGIQNLASDLSGVFTNTTLQSLYDSLTAKADNSLIDALMVGALIEEVDINDLIIAIGQTTDPAVAQMYTRLMNGSYSHLRAFINQLAVQGVTYTAQGPLTQQQVDNILSGENLPIEMNTAQSMDANGIPASSDSCFINQISKNLQVVANNTQFNETDNVHLSSTIKVSSQDQGKNVRLVAVADYTSDSGESFRFMRDNSSWKVWDGNVNSLSFSEQLVLSQEQNIDVFTGQLLGQKGGYVVSVGYVLEDGTIIYNVEPMRFNVQE